MTGFTITMCSITIAKKTATCLLMVVGFRLWVNAAPLTGQLFVGGGLTILTHNDLDGMFNNIVNKIPIAYVSSCAE